MIDKFKTAWNELDPEDKTAIKAVALFFISGFFVLTLIYYAVR